jgi:general secretion pathway protein B
LAANKQTSPLPVASLRLTGIVWSQDPSARCAVINGAIINEGAVIQGSKVVEILPNRVRLIQDGRPFEIQLF